MANIDNTILAQIMLKLSGCKSRTVLWNDWWEGKVFGNGDSDSSTIDRLFNGLVEKSTGLIRKCWWPKEERQPMFEEKLKCKFQEYVNTLSAEGAFDIIEDICRKYGVPEKTIRIINNKYNQNGSMGVISWMITQCRMENGRKNPTQKWKNKTRIGGENRVDLPTISLIEGTILYHPHPDFLSWQEPENWELIKEFNGLIDFSDRDDDSLFVPYLEIFGSECDDVAEFIESKNLSIEMSNSTADIEERVTFLDYSKEVEVEEKAAKKLGYYNHPPKMYLKCMKYQENAGKTGTGELTMYLGSSDYLGQRVYRREISENPDSEERDRLQEVLSGLRGREYQLQNCPWASIGGGAWITVWDECYEKEYIILSLRNPQKVAEVGGILGYSSSGSFDKEDKSPARAMAREINEETGIPEPHKKNLKMISLGVDTERYLIQCSYLFQTEYTIDDVKYFRKNRALSGGEQTNFFVPLAGDILKDFMRQCAFEPGAAYSLMRLLQKRGEW